MTYIYILFIYLLIYCIYIFGMQIIGIYTSPTKNEWGLMLVKQCHKPAIWNDGLCHP